MTAARANSPALRIFVVEDHSDSLEVLRIYLESFGHVILSARNKAEALKDIPAANCDVLLSNIGCHTFRATGITEYLRNGGKLDEIAQQMANHESARTTGLYDRRNDQVSLDEVERILI